MAYSGDPTNSTVDAVYFMLGDTGSSPELAPEEIDWLLTEEGDNTYLAAARAAENMAARFSSEVTRSMGSLSISVGEKADKYKALATSLRTEAAKRGGGPEFIAGSRSTKRAVEADPDRVASDGFRIGMHDYGSYDPATGEWH